MLSNVCGFIISHYVIKYKIKVLQSIVRFVACLCGTWKLIESVKTISIENVITGVLDKNKEHYLRYNDKAKIYDVLRHI